MEPNNLQMYLDFPSHMFTKYFGKRIKSSKLKKLKNIQKYAKISDLPFDQRSLIHREACFPDGPRIPKNPNNLKNRKNHPKRKKLKNISKQAKISDTPFDQRSLIHREARFPPCFVGKISQKKTFFFWFEDFRPLSNKNFQI